MIARIVIFALIVGMAYLNYTNPSFEEHQEALLEEMQYPLSDAAMDKFLKRVDYSNFLVCSFVKSTKGSKLISNGFLNKVKIVDSEWIQKTSTAIQNADSY
ncbi:MAG: hypothetical protein OET90_10520 [Desulfuromonadales bacterium]|nr:hypothetical protein [Desulfuromonadales bacterium]